MQRCSNPGPASPKGMRRRTGGMPGRPPRFSLRLRPPRTAGAGRNTMWKKLGVAGVLALLASCGSGGDEQPPPPPRDSRISAAVAFAEDTPRQQAFLASPGIGYVQAWVRFGPDLADDV